MEVYLPIAQVLINPIEILLLSAIVGVLSGLFGVGGDYKIVFNEFVSETIKNMSSLIKKWETDGSLKNLLELKRN